jgi:dTDP-4-dehydrorhamnose reductase
MILITGSKGQLGLTFSKLLDESGENYVATDAFADATLDDFVSHHIPNTEVAVDITDADAVNRLFSVVKPNVVLHCAAYTKVDDAEDVGKELNENVNVKGTANIANACKNHNSVLVYFSTDYVFNGKQRREYLETDAPDPINAYGRAKYEGEKIIQERLNRYYIIRTSWLFSEYGVNFVHTMQKLVKTNKTIKVVNDQVGRPTYAKTLAEFALYAIKREVLFGIYHLSNAGTATWFDFAKEILHNFDVKVLPTTSEHFPQKAKRPAYSVFNLDKAKRTGFAIPTWQNALHNMLHDNL